MQARIIITAVVTLLLVAVDTQADVFNLGGIRDPLTGTWTGMASLQTVPVGNPE